MGDVGHEVVDLLIKDEYLVDCPLIEEEYFKNFHIEG